MIQMLFQCNFLEVQKQSSQWQQLWVFLCMPSVTSGEGGYAVCHGSQFVNTFPIQTGDSKESQFSTHAFPTLFPYREGGIEIKQSQNVAFKEHIQWCLQYHDC